MPRPRKNALPRYLELNPRNGVYYYRDPSMAKKVNLGRSHAEATAIARRLNERYRLGAESEARRIEARIDLAGPTFGPAFAEFVERYADDYRLKTSTRKLLHQRVSRLRAELDEIQIAVMDTPLLREVLAQSSAFEQTKMRTLLQRFFQFAKSHGQFPAHLPNPVDDLFVDPTRPKQRQRMTLPQFKAIRDAAPSWLAGMMVLALHLALRRTDLVALRFDDVVGDRIVSPIRKTDTDARSTESTSVSFPIHPDVRAVLQRARESSIQAGRCPFVIHRRPSRITARAAKALANGTLEHPAQVLPEYASKAFARARAHAVAETNLFDGMTQRELPTLHEIRSLSSHLYAAAGYRTDEVQDLMAHTDPDMTRAYQRGHARKTTSRGNDASHGDPERRRWDLRTASRLWGCDARGDTIEFAHVGPGSVPGTARSSWRSENVS